ncbi:MAG: TVP38/TMEM64 family protein [Pseudomonadota bacterium]
MTVAPRGKPRVWPLLAIAVALLGLTAAWRWGPLAEGLQPDRLLPALRASGQQLEAWTAILGLALASVLAVPLTVMAVLSMLAFGALHGTLYLMTGASLGGALSFLLGKQLGRGVIEHLAGVRWQRLDQRLSGNGLLAVIAVRMVPVAPFALVNMALGVSSIRLRDFVLGSLIGMLPGTVLIAVSIDQLVAFSLNPGLKQALLTLLGVATLLLAGWLARRWALQRRKI